MVTQIKYYATELVHWIRSYCPNKIVKQFKCPFEEVTYNTHEREPCSKGQRRRLISRRLWSQIPVPDTGWTFFHINLLYNLYCLFEKAENIFNWGQGWPIFLLATINSAMNLHSKIKRYQLLPVVFVSTNPPQISGIPRPEKSVKTNN